MYILQISPTAYIINKEEIIITADYTKATQYQNIGEAMKAAAKVNSTLGTHLTKAVKL